MNILISGGAGYIGTELAHVLAENDSISNIVIYDNLSRQNYNLFLENQFNNGKLKFIHGDILDGRSLKKALSGIDVVIHFAAKVTTPYSDQELHQFEQVNHWGTTELVSHIEQSDVKHCIFLSSAAVYGFDSKPFNENSLAQPVNHYGITKRRAEKEIQRLNDDIRINIVRSANVFGYSRSMRFDSVINRFMFDANFNSKIKVFGDGRQKRAFISIDFLCLLLELLVLNKIDIDIINAVEFNYSINEVIFEFIKKIYPTIDVLYVNQEIPVKSIILNSVFEDQLGITSKKHNLQEYLFQFKSKFSF